MNLFDYLHDSLPRDHARQTRLAQMLQAHIDGGLSVDDILDFGCGEGKSLKLFEQLLPSAKWTGVDIEESPEVNQRKFSDERFVSYNGTELPFADNSFDFVYSHQVLEHVRHPEVVLKEIRRVLKAGGIFMGQTSQFEPYHSYSLWNFTIYGFKRIVEDAGFRLSELRPAVDGFTLMERTYRGRPPEFNKYAFEESPRNKEIEEKAVADGKSVSVVNYRKLMFAGQFSFSCV